MKDRLFSSPRTFRVWSYSVGHLTLLLRSTKEDTSPRSSTRVDVVFVSVRSINIPTTLHGVEIFEADEGECAARGIVLEKDQRLWIVRGQGYDGHIVGGGMGSHEDDKEWNDPAYWDDMERIRAGRT